MSLITRNNYEAFLLDYFEENFSSEQVAELMLFLEKNPELKEDLEEFEQITLIPEAPVFENKASLKKTELIINNNNYEDYLIAEIEGENPKEISNDLQLFLKENSEKLADFETYKKTKLIAPLVIFNDKKDLKRKETKVIPLYWWYTSAAAVVFIFFFLKNFNNTESNTELPIANKVEEVDTNLEKETIEQPIENNEKSTTQVANAQEKEEIIKPDQKTKRNDDPVLNKGVNKKEPLNLPKEEEQQPTILANQEKKQEELVKDTTLIPTEKIDDEALYADVKIVYEEDPIVKPQTPKKEHSKLRKFFTKTLVNRNLLKQKKNEDDEVIAYTLTIGKLGYSKNKAEK